MINQTLGSRLKYAIDIRNMNQREFANKIGITDATISRYIHDQRQPSADVIIIICCTLGISADWLLGLL